MVFGMRYFIRFMAIIGLGGGIIAAAVAMFAEPFFHELYSQLGVDTSKWVTPVLRFVFSEPGHLTIALAIGFGVGVLAHWLATRWDRDHSKKSGNDTVAIQAQADLEKQKRLADKERRVASEKRQISSHEAQRKIMAIDAVLDMLRDFTKLIEKGRHFTASPIRDKNSEEIVAYVEKMRKSLIPLHEFKHSHKEYEDIYALIDREPFAGANQPMSRYASAVRALQKILDSGGDEASAMELMHRLQSEYDGAIHDLEVWCKTSEDALVLKRKMLS